MINANIIPSYNVNMSLLQFFHFIFSTQSRHFGYPNTIFSTNLCWRSNIWKKMIPENPTMSIASLSADDKTNHKQTKITYLTIILKSCCQNKLKKHLCSNQLTWHCCHCVIPLLVKDGCKEKINTTVGNCHWATG